MKPKTFTVTLNTKFFDCAKYVYVSLYVDAYNELCSHDITVCVCRCCGAQIIGCYAPNGEHCERPLEVRSMHSKVAVSSPRVVSECVCVLPLEVRSTPRLLLALHV